MGKFAKLNIYTMEALDLNRLCARVRTLALEVGEFLKEERMKFIFEDIEEKGKNNFVTYVDREAERRIVVNLHRFFPEAGYITEEGTASAHGEMYAWIVDPIDGTTNYIHNAAPYCISIALVKGSETLLGVVYLPQEDELYYAVKDGMAYLNDEVIAVSSFATLPEAYVGFGTPYIDQPFGNMPEIWAELSKKCSIRCKGSAAAETCQVAKGTADAYIHNQLSPWDMAAALLIVRRAGGKVTDFRGSEDCLFGKTFVASNKLIHADLQEIVFKYHQ